MPAKYCPECGTALQLPRMRDMSLAERRELSQLTKPRRKRKLSAWNKYVKANSKKPRFRYARSNKINLKKMAVAFRKTPAGKKRR